MNPNPRVIEGTDLSTLDGNEGFGHSTYTADVRYALAHIFNSTMTDATCEKCVEVNKMKRLFRYAQPWSRQQAHSFIRAARRADAGAGGAEDDGQAGGEDPAGAAEGRRLPLPPHRLGGPLDLLLDLAG